MTTAASMFFTPPTMPHARRTGVLVLLTVLAAHWAALQSLPAGALGRWAGDAAAVVFQTRTVTPELPAQPAADAATPAVTPVVNTPAPAAPRASAVERASAPAAADHTANTPSAAPTDTATDSERPSNEAAPSLALGDQEPIFDLRAVDAMMRDSDHSSQNSGGSGDPSPSDPSRPVFAIAGVSLAGKPAASRHIPYDVSGEVKGTRYSATGDLYWDVKGSDYSAKLVYTILKVFKVTQTSTGRIDAGGLVPTRFSDKRGLGSEKAAHFDADKKLITFSNNSPSQPLMDGAQDELSVALQLGAILNANPGKFPAGTEVQLQVASTGGAGLWTMSAGGREKLTLNGQEFDTVKFSRGPRNTYDSKVEVWLAPTLGHLPVRIRLSQSNGDFVDQSYIAPTR